MNKEYTYKQDQAFEKSIQGRNETALVSIITPYHNAEMSFEETLDSILAQTLKDWEWIIVDDGTNCQKDLDTLKEYAAKTIAANGNIRITKHTKNKGLGAARNTGLREAKCDLVLFLDLGSTLEPTCLEKMYWKLQTHPELAFCACQIMNLDTKTRLWSHNFQNGITFLERNWTVATTMFRRAIALEVGGFNEEHRNSLENLDFWIKCAVNGHWGDTIPEALFSYRCLADYSALWNNSSNEEEKRFKDALPTHHPGLSAATFPRPRHPAHHPNKPISWDLPAVKIHKKTGKKRLLMLLPHFEMGGSDKWNLDILKYLVAHDWETTLAATALNPTNPWLSCFTKITSDVHILHNMLPLADFPRYLRWLIQTRAPDIVCITHSQLAYELLPALRAFFPKTPFVDYVHIDEEYFRSGCFPADSLLRQHALVSTGTASRHLKQWMVKRGAKTSKIKPIYINVDEKYWSKPDEKTIIATREEMGIPKRQFVILYACRFCDQKQPDVFGQTVEKALKAIKNKQIIADIPSDILFLVAGKGEEIYEKLLKKLSDRYPENVRFFGAQDTEGIKKLLEVSDIAFLPSRMEGIALFFYEAMSMGVVPLGADVGGQAELITPECGILIKRETHGKSQEKICEEESTRYADELIVLLADPERLKKMKITARQRIEKHFCLEQMGTAMGKMFTDAIASIRDRNPDLSNPIPVEETPAYASLVIEQYRLQAMLGSPSTDEKLFHRHFRISALSPKFSRTKRNILRFLLKHL